MSRKKLASAARRYALVTMALSSASFVSTAAFADKPADTPLPQCTALAALLLQDSAVTTATSVIQPAAGANASYCSVVLTVSTLAGPKDGYLPDQKQAIGIQVGLPLSAADGGSGGVQGAWSGRNENIGGGGFQGSFSAVPRSVAVAATNGNLGSVTNTGHVAANSRDTSFVLNPDKTLNWGLIRDFAYNSIHEQNIWSKKLANMYYGMGPKYNYWNGCSTGGRQGHMQAQMFGEDFDGIVAGAPAIEEDRLTPALQWGPIAMTQLVGGPISAAKLTAVTKAAIAACDPLDGITDGVIQDPRACSYSAKQFVCTGSASDPANCLTPQEAQAVDNIWTGPTGQEPGTQLWFGFERGTNLNTAIPSQVYANGWLKYWVFRDPTFDLSTLTEESFRQAFLESELNFFAVTGTDDPDLKVFKAHGGKMITYHGLADTIIPSRGTYNYYNRVTERFGNIKNVQSFYRFFPYPGNGHCGAAAADFPNAPQINTTDIFTALVNWVEQGQEPDQLVAYNNRDPALATVSRPICKYPDRLVYNGTGGTNVASSFHCEGAKDDPLMDAQNVLPNPAAVSGNRGLGHGDDHEGHDHGYAQPVR
jgi:hypothetical protein